MTFRTRAQSLGRVVGCAVVNGLGRWRREARVRRLEWQVDRQQAALGTVVYALLRSGQMQTSVPEVNDRMAEVDTLIQRLQQLRNALPHGARGDSAKSGDEARWADEGGQNAV